MKRRSGERGSGIPVPAARHDDDVDNLTHALESKWYNLSWVRVDLVVMTAKRVTSHFPKLQN